MSSAAIFVWRIKCKSKIKGPASYLRGVTQLIDE